MLNKMVVLAWLLLPGLLVQPAAVRAGTPAERPWVDPARRAVELTFLKSRPGQRESLKRFIVENWFAMDRVAQAQGLIADYSIMDSADDNGPWNVLVSVQYHDAAGYEGIATQFERIRQAHVTVPVEGQTLPELGTVVESRRLYLPAVAPRGHDLP